ncbi:hypothetical protein [Paenibacillus dendrobii]|nr:hypothetical protein [Paenibacillus dendrobii]
MLITVYDQAVRFHAKKLRKNGRIQNAASHNAADIPFDPDTLFT